MLNRRTLVLIGLSFLTVFTLQYFTKKDEIPAGQAGDGKVRSGQFYSAPVKQTWHCDPKREIDFIDSEIDSAQEVVTTLQTPLSEVSFSNFGGVVKSLSFKKHKGKEKQNLQTIYNDTLEQREQGCFLLALDEKTPYLYQVVSHEESSESQKIIYQTKTEGWLIKKTYVIQNNSYKVDLILDFEPLKKEAKKLVPRVFFPAPSVLEVPNNMVSSFISKDNVSIEKIYEKDELAGVWGLPEIFGAQDKYFAHTLVKDSKNFSQGGYFTKVNKKLFSILEGEEIANKKSVSLSFYLGPKLLNDLSIVDERLVDLLSFGWLSWICKLLLQLLEFLFKHLGNFGLAIVVLTFLLKLPLLPLTISSRKKMEEYQKFQPTINRIRQKYKNDLKQQQIEIARFHQEHNLSQATPLIGCLPLFIQMPILFSLYRVLGNYLSMYQAPFFGWITDLSAKDPYYILPILMGGTMIWQQQMTPSGDEKQKMMMMFMPIVMVAIFINFPAGLVLYWFVNNFLTVLEDVVRRKFFK